MSSSLSILKNHLKTLSSKEKDDFVLTLWKNPDAKRCIERILGTFDSSPFLEKSLKKLDQYIFGRSGIVLKISDAKKVISTYARETEDDIGTIQLMLSYVERMEKFTRSYGDMESSFYTSVENTFWSALRLTETAHCQKQFLSEIERVAQKIISFGYGYWFSDTIEEYLKDWKEKNQTVLSE